MLRYKSFLDTRFWTLLGLMTLSAQVVALYMSYPMDPATSFPNGALGVTAAEMTRLRTGDFRGYIWLRWFSTTMLLIWPVFAIRLAGTGLEESGGREYLLSLPETRRGIAIARLTVSAAQIAAITIVPSLLVCAMAPLQGQRYPISDALVHSFILMVGGLGLFGLTMLLRVMTRDAAAYVAMGGLIFLVGLFTFLVQGFTPYSIFRVMNGADYFFNHHVPWTGLAVSAIIGCALIWLSVRIVERRDF
jgi:ABC-type transport system involved in multi-copper enzyme maturation permease subunit